jgi:hypothetical protein
MLRHCILGLIGVALVGASPLWAQTPPAVQTGHPVATGPTGAAAPGCVCPETPCCVPSKTICCPEGYVKKTTQFVYCSGCEPLCLCYFHNWCAGLCGSCGGCESGHCEHPYTRRFLIRKVRTCEECATKCVPVTVPVCDQGPCGPGCCAGPAAAHGVVVIPGMPLQSPSTAATPLPNNRAAPPATMVGVPAGAVPSR